MARSSSSSKALSPSHHLWDDVPALVLICTGALLLLALVSYVPDDLPASSFLAPFARTATPNEPAQNFIGRAGAIVAGWFYFLLGAGSYLVTASLLLFGAAKLVFPRLRLVRRAGWAAGLVLAGACLCELQPWFLADWHDRFNLTGRAGGVLGTQLAHLFTTLLGRVGAPVALAAVYACCLVLVTGLHPLAQLARACDALRRGLARWAERRQQVRLARVSERERLELAQRRVSKEQRRLEKRLRRHGVAVPAGAGAGARDGGSDHGDGDDAAEEDEDDEFAHLPPPRITDNSAPPPPPAGSTAKPRPSLSEVLGRGRSEPGGRGQPGAAFGAGDVRFANYQLPEPELLDTRETQDHQVLNTKELELIQGKIIETLEQFGIKVSPGDITKGPTITRYEVYPAKGVRVDRIVSLEKDIARATRAERINILAPIPGKDTVGIEIANAKKVKVTLRELLESAEWHETKARIPIALGKDVYGKTLVADLAAMPHCLIAGATGSGKSVCVNTIVASLLYRFTPEQLRLVMVDPKVVELQMYNELPHLVVPVVTDPKKVLLALRWVIEEMMRRYELFAKTGVRNVTGYNARPPSAPAPAPAPTPVLAAGPVLPVVLPPARAADLLGAAAAAGPPGSDGGNADAAASASAFASASAEADADQAEAEAAAHFAGPTAGPLSGRGAAPAAPVTPAAPAGRVPRDAEPRPEQMPYIVVIIDELADLMQTAPADVESAIARITQMARAAGIHLIVATQTPRADVVTGVIKANVPSRIAFQVSGALDSRVILDENGAERLLGQGDMLYRPPGTSRLVRAQGVFITDEEAHRLVAFCAAQGAPAFEASIHEQLSANFSAEEEITDEDEELVQKCIEIMRQEKKASTSMLQRRLRLGYTRAARVVDILEKRGVVGPENGARGREILVDLEQPL